MYWLSGLSGLMLYIRCCWVVVPLSFSTFQTHRFSYADGWLPAVHNHILSARHVVSDGLRKALQPCCLLGNGFGMCTAINQMVQQCIHWRVVIRVVCHCDNVLGNIKPQDTRRKNQYSRVTDINSKLGEVLNSLSILNMPVSKYNGTRIETLALTARGSTVHILLAHSTVYMVTGHSVPICSVHKHI